MSRLILPQCVAIEHTDIGAVPFRCDLDTGHKGPHEHTFPELGLFTWSDTPRATVTTTASARHQRHRRELDGRSE